ncbi:MAG TPA: flagellar basal body P-ring formation chaperone FlgA [Acetobacteraceae bacterium]|jgi:flagella basal body P-ring formation protein FlgA
MRPLRVFIGLLLTASALAGLTLAGVLAAGTLAAAAHAASLRTATMLHAPVVRLSDLFDDAGANADRVLGPAPGPGGSIVVEAPQLNAIARQFGVDWRPASPAERAVLERAGRLLPRDDVLKAAKTALIAAGASPGCEVELPGFTPPMVPVEAKPQALATELDYDAASGRFSAVLSVTGDGMEPVNLRLAGQVNDTIDLPVAVARLGIGTVVRADDVRVARVPVAMVHNEVLHAAIDVIGMQLRHSVVAGQPFAVVDMMRPTLVQRGANVQMQLLSPGISLVAQGVAMDSGATGERIRVLNPSSRAVVEAEVIGPGQVRVTPESAPISTASRATEGLVQ